MRRAKIRRKRSNRTLLLERVRKVWFTSNTIVPQHFVLQVACFQIYGLALAFEYLDSD
jgi:hypothetical protein